MIVWVCSDLETLNDWVSKPVPASGIRLSTFLARVLPLTNMSGNTHKKRMTDPHSPILEGQAHVYLLTYNQKSSYISPTLSVAVFVSLFHRPIPEHQTTWKRSNHNPSCSRAI